MQCKLARFTLFKDMEYPTAPRSMGELNALATNELLKFALEGNQAFEQIQQELNYIDRPEFERLQKLYIGLASIALLCDRWIQSELHVAYTIPKQKLGELLRIPLTEDEMNQIRQYYDETYTAPTRSVINLPVVTQTRVPINTPETVKKKFRTVIPKLDPHEVAARRQELLEAGEITLDSYKSYANCVNVDPVIFFPEQYQSNRPAKEICSGCVVRQECLEDALLNDEKFGVRGGKSERERRSIRRQRALTRRTA